MSNHCRIDVKSMPNRREGEVDSRVGSGGAVANNPLTTGLGVLFHRRNCEMKSPRLVDAS